MLYEVCCLSNNKDYVSQLSHFTGLHFSFVSLVFNSGHYPSSCLLFKTQHNSIGLSVPHRKHITSPLRTQQVNDIYRFVMSVFHAFIYGRRQSFQNFMFFTTVVFIPSCPSTPGCNLSSNLYPKSIGV
jgi:hypothetical protein